MSEQITPNPSVPTQIVADGLKFPKFVSNLGIIPTSYKDSMTYYETLAWLCKYLEETVIPTVNQNGEAVEELQNLYIELNSYVTHYFDNLDVQEEINRKLDNMVTSGALQEIVNNLFDTLRSDVNNALTNQNTKIDNLVTNTNTQLASQTTQMSNLNSRMDSFTHLTEGSTTGDAELIDGRVGYNGTTYSTIGDAIRNQVSEIHTEIYPYSEKWYPHVYDNVNGTTFPYVGYIRYSDGTIQDTTSGNWAYSELIKVDVGAQITCKIRSISGNIVATLAAYDSNGNYLQNKSIGEAVVQSYTVPEGVSYIRFCKSAPYLDNYFTILTGAYIKGYIAHLNNELLKYKLINKRVICIGDSYGIQNIDGDITKFYWEYFKECLNLTEGTSFYKKYLSGAGFGNGEFLSNLQSLASSITDKDTITDIFVCGGWNDSDTSQSYGTDEAFNQGALNFYNYVKATYKNARVSIAHISWGSLGEAMMDKLNLSLKRYKAMSNKYSYNYIVNSEYILHNYSLSMWQSDFSHPNQAGQQLLGESLTFGFLEGSCDIYYSDTETDFTPFGQSREIVGKTISSVNNNIANISCISDNGLISINGVTDGGLNVSGSVEYGIAYINSQYYRGYRNEAKISIPCFIKTKTSYYQGIAKIRISSRQVYASFFVPHDNSLAYLGNVTNVYLQNFKINTYAMKA